MLPDREIYTPPGGPPQKPVDRELFSVLGEEKIRRMLLLHYQALAESGISYMFPDDPDALAAAADRSADFFIQIMGGPAYYSERRGPARMRMRHLPFEIHTAARDLWLECFRDALDALPFPDDRRADFEEFLDGFSMWMVNAR